MTNRLAALCTAALGVPLLTAATVLLFRLPADAGDAPPPYTVRSVDGQAALFRAGEAAPVARYEVYTALLPSADAALLEAGVRVQSLAEALRVLEDYGL